MTFNYLCQSWYYPNMLAGNKKFSQYVHLKQIYFRSVRKKQNAITSNST